MTAFLYVKPRCFVEDVLKIRRVVNGCLPRLGLVRATPWQMTCIYILSPPSHPSLQPSPLSLVMNATPAVLQSFSHLFDIGLPPSRQFAPAAGFNASIFAPWPQPSDTTWSKATNTIIRLTLTQSYVKLFSLSRLSILTQSQHVQQPLRTLNLNSPGPLPPVYTSQESVCGELFPPRQPDSSVPKPHNVTPIVEPSTPSHLFQLGRLDEG